MSMDLQLNKFESPSPKDAFAKFGLNWPCGSWKEDENVKSLQIDRETDGRKDDELKAFSSGELKIVYCSWQPSTEHF